MNFSLLGRPRPPRRTRRLLLLVTLVVVASGLSVSFGGTASAATPQIAELFQPTGSANPLPASPIPTITDQSTVEVVVSATGSPLSVGEKATIYECADADGMADDLPTDSSTCDGLTLNAGKTLTIGAGGTVNDTSYPIYQLPSAALFESAGAQPLCNATEACVLYVGQDINDFTQPYVLSTPFYVSCPTGTTCTPATTTGTPIVGEGSSFAGPEMSQWDFDVAQSPYDLPVYYTSSSSSEGRFDFANQTVNYAVSDIPYQPAPFDPKLPTFPFAYIPISGDGIAFMYHINGLTTTLQLSSYSACAVMTGAVPYWDDPIIQADNPGVRLPHIAVHPVTRSDLAGTNYALQEYCIDEQPALWAAFVNFPSIRGLAGQVSDLSATQPRPDWPLFPTAVPVSGSATAADTVADPDNNGYITAVETAYAGERDMPVASVKNASGFYTQPSPLNVDSALAYATQEPDGVQVLNFNGTGPHVYNPSTYSYLLTPTTGWNPGKAATMSAYLDYALTLGQQQAPSIGFAPLGLSLEQYGVDAEQADFPSPVPLTAAEQEAYACGDLTPAEVQAGATSPTCGVNTGTTTTTLPCVTTTTFTTTIITTFPTTTTTTSPCSQSPSNLVTNGSFELPAITSGFAVYPVGTTALTGWTVSNGSVSSVYDSVEQFASNLWPADTGSVSLDLAGYAPGEISQTIPTVAGTQYTLSFATGGDFYCGNTVKTMAVYWNGGIVDAPSFNTSGSSATNMNWQHDSVTVSATGSTTMLAFADTTPDQSSCGAVLDSVELVVDPPAVTPEIAIPVLLPIVALAFGGVGYGVKRRRDRRRTKVTVT